MVGHDSFSAIKIHTSRIGYIRDISAFYNTVMHKLGSRLLHIRNPNTYSVSLDKSGVSYLTT